MNVGEVRAITSCNKNRPVNVAKVMQLTNNRFAGMKDGVKYIQG